MKERGGGRRRGREGMSEGGARRKEGKGREGG